VGDHLTLFLTLSLTLNLTLTLTLTLLLTLSLTLNLTLTLFLTLNLTLNVTVIGLGGLPRFCPYYLLMCGDLGICTLWSDSGYVNALLPHLL